MFAFGIAMHCTQSSELNDGLLTLGSCEERTGERIFNHINLQLHLYFYLSEPVSICCYMKRSKTNKTSCKLFF